MKYIIFLILLLPQLASAFECTSTASGDFETASTWTSCNSTYPQPGDNVYIGAHTVTLAADATIDVRSITLNNDSAVFTIGNGATLNLSAANSNIIDVTTGELDATAGGITFNATDTTTTNNCIWRQGYTFNGTAKTRIGASITSDRTAITTAGCKFRFNQNNGSGYPQDYIIYNLDIDSSAGSTNTADQIFGIFLSSAGGVVNQFYLENSTIIGSLGVFTNGATAVDSDADLTLKDNYFEQESTSNTYKTLYFNFFNAMNAGGTRTIDGNVINGQLYIQENRGLTFDNNIFLAQNSNTLDAVFTNSQDFAMVSFSGNLFQHEDAYNINIDAATMDGNYFWSSKTAKTNPHGPNFPTRNIGSMTVSNNIFEFSGTNNDGDSFLLATPASGNTTVTFTNNIILPSSGGGAAWGTLFSALGNANMTLIANHNTMYLAGDTGNNTGSVIGETYSPHAGMLSSYRSNLHWADDATPTLTLYGIKDSTGVTTDVATSSSIDYNTQWNTGTGASFGCEDGFVFSSGTACANNENSDPEFYDSTRNLLKFYEHCSGDITPTYAEFETEIAKKNDSRAAYDTCYDDYHTWVKTGFSPAAGWAGTDAGHDSVTIGAVESGLTDGSANYLQLLTGVG